MSTGADGPGDSPIEAYLDGLVREMAAHDPRELRSLLAEAEAHLWDDVQALRSAGTPPREAERIALARFGAARDLAVADRNRSGGPARAVAGQVVASGLRLGGIGALTVGISGLIAGLLRLIAGPTFLIDVSPGRLLSAGDCARWLAADPGAASCRDAAVRDWVGEVVGYRVIVGLLGLGALFAYRALRRRRPLAWAGLPAPVDNTIALTLFGLAGAGTLVAGIDAMVTTAGHGAGQWLSATPVALAAATVFGWRLVGQMGRTAR